MGSSSFLLLVRHAYVDDLPPFSNASQRLSLEDQIDPSRVTDIEQKKVRGPTLDPVTRPEQYLGGRIVVFRDPRPGKLFGFDDQMQPFFGCALG